MGFPGGSVGKNPPANIGNPGDVGSVYWSGLPCPSPGDLPNPRIELASLMSPALATGFFTTRATWEAQPIYGFIFFTLFHEKKVKMMLQFMG